MQINALTALWCVVYIMLSSQDAILIKNLQLLNGYDATKNTWELTDKGVNWTNTVDAERCVTVFGAIFTIESTTLYKNTAMCTKTTVDRCSVVQRCTKYLSGKFGALLAFPTVKGTFTQPPLTMHLDTAI